MNPRPQHPVGGIRHRAAHGLLVLTLLGAAGAVQATDLADLCADRTAMERVYHEHRLGAKTPFAQTMPPTLIERLVREDLHKEAVLGKTYGVTLTPAMIEAEVRRILTTTLAPDTLAELRRALGDDPARFAASMARPLLVERELRRRFNNDDSLHAATRRAADQARAHLLVGQPVEGLQTVTWQLAPRPTPATPEPDAAPPSTATSGAYTIEATARLSRVIAPPVHAAPGEETPYLDDLDPELRAVLLVQLAKPGDVSAVIETPAAFLVFHAKSRNKETLAAASLTLPKRSYAEWLAEAPAAQQPASAP